MCHRDAIFYVDLPRAVSLSLSLLGPGQAVQQQGEACKLLYDLKRRMFAVSLVLT